MKPVRLSISDEPISNAPANTRLAIDDSVSSNGGESVFSDDSATYLPRLDPLKLSVTFNLSDFESRERIASGYFGDVYRVGSGGGDESSNRTDRGVMVLKMPARSNPTDSFCGLVREINLLNTLQHPNIVRLIGGCYDGDACYPLLEWANSGDLERTLIDKSISISWQQRQFIALGIAEGMKFIHRRGFFHRDLSSRNILIKRSGDDRSASFTHLHPVIADFGLAAAIPNDPRQLEPVGSPWWMAPECLKYQPHRGYDEKIDVFSYGIVLFQIYARIVADPDVLPRNKYFGVAYMSIAEKYQVAAGAEENEGVGGETNRIRMLIFGCGVHCCSIEPLDRPSFENIVVGFETNRIFNKLGRNNRLSRAVSTPNISIWLQTLLFSDPYYEASHANPFHSVHCSDKWLDGDGSGECGHRLIGSQSEGFFDVSRPSWLFSLSSIRQKRNGRRSCVDRTRRTSNNVRQVIDYYEMLNKRSSSTTSESVSVDRLSLPIRVHRSASTTPTPDDDVNVTALENSDPP